MNKCFLKFEKYLGSVLLKLFNLTIKKEIYGQYPNQPVVFMIWHRDQIPLTYLHVNKNIGVLVSQSNDGELIAGPISMLGYKPIRGSSTRGGTQALRGLISHLKHSCVAITPDGPRGPVYSIKDGLLTTAYLAKRPIIPVAIDVNREWVFNSWDRFRFPKPFSKIRIKYGQAVYVNTKDEFPAKKDLLAKDIKSLYESIKFS